MTKIDVFGGCVSRDVFNFCHESSLKVGTYIARFTMKMDITRLLQGNFII